MPSRTRWRFWALPVGSGFPLQVLGPKRACGLSSAIPSASPIRPRTAAPCSAFSRFLPMVVGLLAAPHRAALPTAPHKSHRPPQAPKLSAGPKTARRFFLPPTGGAPFLQAVALRAVQCAAGAPPCFGRVHCTALRSLVPGGPCAGALYGHPAPLITHPSGQRRPRRPPPLARPYRAGCAGALRYALLALGFTSCMGNPSLCPLPVEAPGRCAPQSGVGGIPPRPSLRCASCHSVG